MWKDLFLKSCWTGRIAKLVLQSLLLADIGQSKGDQLFTVGRLWLFVIVSPVIYIVIPERPSSNYSHGKASDSYLE